MSDPSDSLGNADENGELQREPSILGHLVQRIKSQPLLLAVAVLLILANVAAASIEGLRALLPPALAIFVVAIVAWMVVELARFRRQTPKAAGDDIRVSVRKIGKSGEVLGVDDESGASATVSTSVKIKAEDVQGRVVGVRRGPRRP